MIYKKSNFDYKINKKAWYVDKLLYNIQTLGMGKKGSTVRINL